MTVNCNNTIIAGANDVLVAPVGKAENEAVSLGATNGGITLTAAVEKTAVNVDQSLMPVRHIATAANYTLSIPLAEITADNIARAFGVDIDENGLCALKPEEYFQVWIKTKGPVNSAGKEALRTFRFAKVSFNGTGELALSRTDQQSVTLEGTVINCPSEGENGGFMTVTDVYPAEA